MNRQNNVIKSYYQFVAECLLFYFFLRPVMIITGVSVAYWIYMFLIVLAMVLTAIGRMWMRTYHLYVLLFIALLTIQLYIFNFPLTIGAVTALFMVWRQAVHAEDPDLEHQMKLILLMLGIFLIELVVMYDDTLIWVALTFLTVMLGGYMASHVHTVSKTNTLQQGFVLTMTGAMLIGGGLLYTAYDVIRPVASLLWGGAAQLLMLFAKGIGFLIEISPFKLEGLRDVIRSHSTNGVKMELPDDTFMPRGVTDKRAEVPSQELSWWIWVLVIITIILVLIYWARKRKLTDNQMEMTKGIDNWEEENQQKQDAPWSHEYTAERKEVLEHPVRLQVLHLEKTAQRHGYGRWRSETIEEWLYRLGTDSSALNIYQDVRYGAKSVTRSDEEKFIQQMERLEEWIEQKSQE
ncbi:DUF4129 domain-containing protein [Virgibacillus halodenitrificans]|uniref:DUF4129 domain-containing protein n=1 Tax=Virgibacillus halodenitrificans TaxID=1482 RepID=UPI0024BF6B9B|nr:DUF4129 domain-containing protein [Virgibacillus halodenitrificans]WHX24561.1 DUF4129 domain-containing protein [Virgibacillus halodenitrificans]